MNNKRRVSYGWVVVAAAFSITCITCGINFSYGVFFLPVVGEFGWSRGLASVVALVAGLTYALTMPLTGMLADRYGYKWVLTISISLLSIGLFLSSQLHDIWQLYLFYGLFVGLSISASFAIPVSLVALWFNRRQGLAVGMATLGISVGTALIPLVITYLIGSLGWRDTFVIAAVAVAVICIPSAILMRRPSNAEVRAMEISEGSPGAAADLPSPDDLDSGLTLAGALRTRQFWMVFAIFLFFLLTLGVVMLHIVPYAVDSGMTPVQAAILLTLIGVFGIAGRLLSGLVSDRVGIKPVIIFCLLALSLITVFIAFFNDPWAFYIYAAAYGVVYSGFVTMMVRMARQVFGARALGSVFGGLMVSDGIGFGVGPFLAGYIFDATGSYRISFIAVAAGLVIAAVLTIIVKPAYRLKSN
jgi:MFS transporter, OFA family, oxalate/formate antiporter